MEKRVQLFVEADIGQLQESVNLFLKKTKGKLIDIKFQANPMAVWPYVTLLIYTPEKDKE